MLSEPNDYFQRLLQLRNHRKHWRANQPLCLSTWAKQTTQCNLWKDGAIHWSRFPRLCTTCRRVTLQRQDKSRLGGEHTASKSVRDFFTLLTIMTRFQLDSQDMTSCSKWNLYLTHSLWASIVSQWMTAFVWISLLSLSRGKSKLKQYTPMKPKQWGYKVFILADQNGIVHNSTSTHTPFCQEMGI